MLEIDLIRYVKVVGKPALYGCTDVAPIANENSRLLKYLVGQQKTAHAYQGIICSPLRRCQLLATKFSQLCQLPLEISAGLQEMNFGCFDGMPFDDIPFDGQGHNISNQDKCFKQPKAKAHCSQLEAFFQAPAEVILPQAEASADFHCRVIKAWQNLLTQQVAIANEQRENFYAKPQGPLAKKRPH
ncbi:histidine phosphatase family protein [Colwellia sp. TT2012]|uniref:histidine phosphatase family protein n=1 Tax=Colwellia sp. TT2012 TaxID=1720342 RepID=UPI00070A54D7|nr:histidine phosphatase family protein [Colwellia sp. TT2012]